MQGASAQRFIVLTDIGGSSRLWEQFPQQYPVALALHNETIEGCISGRGELVKNLGDGYLAVFERVDDALDAAITLQLRLGGADTPEELVFDADNRLAVRTVVHGGNLQRVAEANDWFGPPLNRAARIAGVAHPGQTLLSGFARQRLATLSSELALTDLGPVRLRDLGEPEQLYQISHPGFAQTEFPPLLGMDSRPNNLREQPGAFIGRVEELRTLRRLLQDGQRLVTLTAPGGYGKSRCANQLCASLLHRYEHGAWVVELAPLADAQHIAERTADALGASLHGTAKPREQLLDYLRAKHALLHFDNFEHLIDGAELVSEILAEAPGVQCVVTSRNPLRVRGEKVVALAPLSAGGTGENGEAANGSGGSAGLPAAVELFVDRAGLVSERFVLDSDNLPVVHALCSRLDGVPLAVELAAAWADQFTPEELLAEMSQQLDLTARMADVPERQRSVRASCDWSWNLLSAEQRTALMQLAVFRGGFYPEAAGELLGLSGMPLRAMLAALCDKSWLHTREVEGRTRYFIRDAAAREYVWEKLSATRATGNADTPYEHAVTAHADYYARLADHEGQRLSGDGTPTGQLEALKSWRIELANIVEALDTAMHRQRPDLLIPIAHRLSRYFSITGGYAEAAQRYGAMLEASRNLCCPELELHSRLGLGWAQSQLGSYADARASATAAQQLAQELQNSQGEADSMMLAASIFGDTGDSGTAKELLTKALSIFRGLGNCRDEASCLNSLGIVALRSKGKGAEARALLTKALTINAELGEIVGESANLSNLGLVCSHQGDLPAAKELYSQALEKHFCTGNRLFQANTMMNLCMVDFAENDFAAARTRMLDALALYCEIGYRRGMIRACGAGVNGLASLGLFAEAATAESGCRSTAAALGLQFGPLEQPIIDSINAKIAAAIESGSLPVDEHARCQAAGSAQSLDELVDYTLRALNAATPAVAT